MKFRGHETFHIRKGWLYKGLKNVKKNDRFFLDNDINPTDFLGIGTSMVKSLRYWLQAVGLTTEEREGNTIHQRFTPFGKIIMGNDKYMEEEGTLWYLHYKLASNKELATTWYWFFNVFNMNEFSKEEFVNSLDSYIRYNLKDKPVAMRSLEDDYNCLINTYLSRKKRYPNKKISPEENLDCPLGELNLLDIVDKKRKIIKKSKLRKDAIHPLIILSIIIDQYEKYEYKNESKEIKIANLLNNPCNIGRIFNMNLNTLNHYLDRLQELRYITVTRTAGLDVINLRTDLDSLETLKKYYKEIGSLEVRDF
ncbi:MAG: DUF4007 family protein [Firmicutes bacterium]|nr:DUF4007 family protein [Bacillota bacterium]